MTLAAPTLEELILLRKDEQEKAQADHTRACAERAVAALGPRVAEALRQGTPQGWEIQHGSALHRFPFRKGEYHLVVNALLGANRVDVELRFVDTRFAVLTKRTDIAQLDEDWFLNSLEMLSTQIAERLVNPRNFT